LSWHVINRAGIKLQYNDSRFIAHLFNIIFKVYFMRGESEERTSEREL
jgi:hypothetical protein